jgi:hypothetical protein
VDCIANTNRESSNSHAEFAWTVTPPPNDSLKPSLGIEGRDLKSVTGRGKNATLAVNSNSRGDIAELNRI